MNFCRARKGFTLVECMLAGALLCMMVTILFSGVTIANKISADNVERMALRARAEDRAWSVFNLPREGLDLLVERYKDGSKKTWPWENESEHPCWVTKLPSDNYQIEVPIATDFSDENAPLIKYERTCVIERMGER